MLNSKYTPGRYKSLSVPFSSHLPVRGQQVIVSTVTAS